MQEVKCSCKNAFQDKHYGQQMRAVTPVNKSRDLKTKMVQKVRCTSCAKEHQAPVNYES